MHTFAYVVVLVAITEFDGLVNSGRRTRGHRCAEATLNTIDINDVYTTNACFRSPFAVWTSTSTVGLPRESKIYKRKASTPTSVRCPTDGYMLAQHTWRAWTFEMDMSFFENGGGGWTETRDGWGRKGRRVLKDSLEFRGVDCDRRDASRF